MYEVASKVSRFRLVHGDGVNSEKGFVAAVDYGARHVMMGFRQFRLGRLVKITPWHMARALCSQGIWVPMTMPGSVPGCRIRRATLRLPVVLWPASVTPGRTLLVSDPPDLIATGGRRRGLRVALASGRNSGNSRIHRGMEDLWTRIHRRTDGAEMKPGAPVQCVSRTCFCRVARSAVTALPGFLDRSLDPPVVAHGVVDAGNPMVRQHLNPVILTAPCIMMVMCC